MTRHVRELSLLPPSCCQATPDHAVCHAVPAQSAVMEFLPVITQTNRTDIWEYLPCFILRGSGVQGVLLQLQYLI